MDWVTLSCNVDDFCQDVEPEFQRRLLAGPTRSRNRSCQLSLSEMMTIGFGLHARHYRDFKAYYLNLVERHADWFPTLMRYWRFNGLMSRLIIPLTSYLQTRFGSCSGISFVDSTPLAVCGNKRIDRNRVFEGVAALGKSTIGEIDNGGLWVQTALGYQRLR